MVTEDEAPLPPERAKALELWLEGNGDAEIAEVLGYDRTAVWRWRTQDPQIVAALAEAQRQRFEAASSTLALASLEAVEWMVRTIRDPNAKPERRDRAAEQVLDRAGIVASKLRDRKSDTDDDNRPATAEELLEAQQIADRLQAAKGQR